MKGINVPSRVTQEGIIKHERLGKRASQVMKAEDTARRARGYMRVFILFAVIAAIQAFAYTLPVDFRWIIGFTLAIIGLIWLMMGTYFIVTSYKEDNEEEMEIGKNLFVISVVVFLTAVINLYIYGYDPIVFGSYRGRNFIPLIAALVWLLAAAGYLYKTWKEISFASAVREREKLPKGTIRYSDVGDGSELFISKKHMISGRPDMIVERNGKKVPVEVKTGRIPRGPFFSHILQISAYCLILEEVLGERPPYGIIKYGDVEFKIDYTDELKALLLEKIEAMRESLKTGVAHRNHHRPGKCKNCSRRKYCPERLS